MVREQTRAEWRAGLGAIREGRVVVMTMKAPPDGFFVPHGTYSIHALDGGNRVRCFPSLTLARQQPKEYVFD
ncbi:MAG TPA: hypothetical protein VM733_15635 [Thermoanaerobaculia bacterium]|nr:hypothetical protein [Thermoanaerobaculia bacterium]